MRGLYPLLFQPIFKQRVWGGRRLARWFPGLPEGPIGEAWILSDHPQGRTRVANGPWAGETLALLCQRHGARLLGTAGVRGMGAAGGGAEARAAAFPLLFKLLDAGDDLSVQVHPGDGYAGLPPGERGKAEMWLVLDAAPGSKLVHGLAPGVTPEAFARAVGEGRAMEALRQFTVRPQDVLYIPPGTVHALGAGLLVAEIQQSSDIVYRVYDYGRPGLDGRPRELHVPDALRVISYQPPPEVVRLDALGANEWRASVRSPYFEVFAGRCEGSWMQAASPESFQVLLVLEGEGSIAWGAPGGIPGGQHGGEEGLRPGAAVLIPAEQGSYRLQGAFSALMVKMP